MKHLLLTAAIVAAVLSGAAAGGDAWVGLDTVSGNLALEVKLGYRDGSNELLYAGLWNSGPNTNVIEVKNLQASPAGVSVGMSVDNADNGALFAMGDWCIGPTFAVLPYVKDFNVNVLRYNLGDGTVATLQIPASTADQYTSTDCFTLNNSSEFVIAANNFDQKRLDYFRSLDAGLSWSLSLTYKPPGADIIDAFAGGFRDTHGAIDDQLIGSTYQRADGALESVGLDWAGNVSGLTPHGDHSSFVGNGFLKETDGLQFNPFALGVVNLGSEVAAGSIDMADGTFDFTFVNSVAPGLFLPFQGVTLSPFDNKGNAEVHYFSSRHARILFDSGLGAPELIGGYPFQDNGGPVDSAASSELARIFVAGIYQGGNRGAGGPVTAVATLDPAVVIAGGGAAAVPALDLRMLVLLGALLLVAGGLVLRRQSSMGTQVDVRESRWGG